MTTYHVVLMTNPKSPWAVLANTPDDSEGRIMAECPTEADAFSIVAALRLQPDLAKTYGQLKAVPTLRDTFAMHALSGLLAGGDDIYDPKEVATNAYEMADAMLKQREGTGS